MPTSRKVLCAVYGAIAVVALIATWSNGGPYVHSVTDFLVNFWRDTKVTSASRFITADILMFALAAAASLGFVPGVAQANFTLQYTGAPDVVAGIGWVAGEGLTGQAGRP